VLCEHLDQFCIAYLDDIVVYSNLLEQHREHVRLIRAKLQEAGLYLKLSKCDFEMQRISFVGFIVTPEGVKIDPDRVRTIAKWPEPASHRDIQVFLSFANFYRRYISSFSHLAKSIIVLLKARSNGHFLGPFLPTPAIKRSFMELCNTFTKVPVLANFDPARPICLETDALGLPLQASSRCSRTRSAVVRKAPRTVRKNQISPTRATGTRWLSSLRACRQRSGTTP
jgi:hypothetical protein